MRIPAHAWALAKEAARHLLKRPVVGLAAVARTPDGKLLLIRRGDTGEWALPGGTLEWGETLHASLARELAEECGTELIEAGALVGVYARPERDPRFHAVTIAVNAKVAVPTRPPVNALEIRDVRAFDDDALPAPLAFGMEDMVRDAMSKRAPTWE